MGAGLDLLPGQILSRVTKKVGVFHVAIDSERFFARRQTDG